MVSIKVNDVFEELSEENERLSNELLFANKCLNVLNKIKTFNDLNCDKLKTNLDSNGIKTFDELHEEVKQLFEEKYIKQELIITELLLSEADKASRISSYTQRNKISNKRRKPNVKLGRPPKPLIKTEEQSPVKEIEGPFFSEIRDEAKQHCKSQRVQYVCTHSDCGKGFRTKLNLKRHLRTHGLNLYERFVCGHSGCSFRSHYSEELTEHLSVHNGVKPHECNVCGKGFLGKQILRAHMQRIHEMSDKTLICEFCNKEFKNKLSFETHRKNSHLTEKRFKCDKCEYRCIDKYRLQLHLMGKHNSERKFECTHKGCGKTFKTPVTLKVHQYCHYPKVFARCPHEDCAKVVRKNRLRRHIANNHSGNKHRCDWPGCDYNTKNLSNLKVHRFVHSSDYNLICDWPDCGKRFKMKKYLENHLRIHKNEKRYACSWPGCQYRCTDSGNLNKHKRVHLK